ncbi:uncharacterized protein LOC115890587 [Sitophilus oryzae]|uniref:Uncharacterized protein LOC115890587 n=1 Tax=Sitophilus oryzae TaxID=7048 RepID=A0A6J2YRL9_SITOR|nr:uncharacterized protein LOC115890587 [Sitophilus oryzae]
MGNLRVTATDSLLSSFIDFSIDNSYISPPTWTLEDTNHTNQTNTANTASAVELLDFGSCFYNAEDMDSSPFSFPQQEKYSEDPTSVTNEIYQFLHNNATIAEYEAEYNAMPTTNNSYESNSNESNNIEYHTNTVNYLTAVHQQPCEFYGPFVGSNVKEFMSKASLEMKILQEIVRIYSETHLSQLGDYDDAARRFLQNGFPRKKSLHMYRVGQIRRF